MQRIADMGPYHIFLKKLNKQKVMFEKQTSKEQNNQTSHENIN